MKQVPGREHSLGEVHGSINTSVSGPWYRRLFVFFGPAYLISVGYMDPGNWATDLAGGSRFGYALIWVLLMSNLMAILLQNLSARLGIVRGLDLAQANRETFPKFINGALYLLAELAIAACDLAEVLGMAIGIQLLTGLPLVYGVVITALDTFLLLFLQRQGMRKMEAFIIGLIAVVGLSFLVEIFLAKPPLGSVVRGLIPTLPGRDALYISIGIIGATVMPHNLYLHSALVQTRKIQKGSAAMRQALTLNFADSAIALNLAFLVNCAILVLAAKVFHDSGNTAVASIKEAHQLLSPMLGSQLAPKLFAIALIAAGQSSTITGTLAGQIVMEGYLQLRINPVLRRLMTRLLAIVPAVLVIWLSGESRVDGLLVFSQVILSMQLGFAVIPLIHFVSNRTTMGAFVVGGWVKFLAWSVAAILVYLNIRLVGEEVMGFLQSRPSAVATAGVAVGCLAGMALLGYVLIHPWLRKGLRGRAASTMHGTPEAVLELKKPAFSRIAVALDFGEGDEKLLRFAVGQGSAGSTYLLIHVVESASTLLLGSDTGDQETRSDQERLDFYKNLLEAQGFRVITLLGYQSRTREIVRMVRENAADLLVIGSHGHSGLQDFIFGETVNTVRHELKIPVLIVNQ